MPIKRKAYGINCNASIYERVEDNISCYLVEELVEGRFCIFLADALAVLGS